MQVDLDKTFKMFAQYQAWEKKYTTGAARYFTELKAVCWRILYRVHLKAGSEHPDHAMCELPLHKKKMNVCGVHPEAPKNLFRDAIVLSPNQRAVAVILDAPVEEGGRHTIRATDVVFLVAQERTADHDGGIFVTRSLLHKSVVLRGPAVKK